MQEVVNACSAYQSMSNPAKEQQAEAEELSENNVSQGKSPSKMDQSACSAYQSMSNPAPTVITLDFTVDESSLNTEQQVSLSLIKSEEKQQHQAEADSFSSTEEDFDCEMTPERQAFNEEADDEEEQQQQAEAEEFAENNVSQGKSPSKMDQSACGGNSQITDLEVKVSSNTAHQRIYDKKNFCLYCERPFAKITRHLMQKHRNKAEVAEAFVHKQGSAMRNLLLGKIRNMGNYNHNCLVLSSGKGQIIPKRQATHRTIATDYLPCRFCCAMYLKTDLWRHHKHCKLQVEKDRPLKRGVQARCSLMLPLMDKTVSNRLKNILEDMTRDSVTDLVKSDALIISLGERMFPKNGEVGRQRADVRNKMRELARLVLMARTIDKDIVYLRDLINPGKFNTVLEAVKKVTGFDESTNRFSTPTTARKLRHSLVIVTHILQGEALRQEDDALKGTAEQFHKLIELQLTTRVS
ncbi:uncharacterized protein LOC131468730 [Solea solea]|uniref:uncharacterized protein LOC131468730 n=1 Tax=Solea solea TaxID=90069 RepID=UPI0027296D98|nr:uncharacterized protein LOC131468730 [Solea solea]